MSSESGALGRQSDLEGERGECRPLDLLGAIRLAVEASRLTSAETAFALVKWLVEEWNPDDHSEQSVRAFIAAIKAVRGAR